MHGLCILSTMKNVLIQCRLPEPKAKKLAEIAKRESRSKSAQVKVFVEKCLEGESQPQLAKAS
jgi:predicted DNA-binding protein